MHVLREHKAVLEYALERFLPEDLFSFDRIDQNRAFGIWYKPHKFARCQVALRRKKDCYEVFLGSHPLIFGNGNRIEVLCEHHTPCQLLKRCFSLKKGKFHLLHIAND